MGEPPSPQGVRTFDDLAARLRLLQAWSGVGYHELHRRVLRARRSRGFPERPSYNTVYRCLQAGRRRMDVELVVDIARVLLGDDDRAAQWRLAYQVVAGHAAEAGVVSASGSWPDDLAEFTGRGPEVGRVLDALDQGRAAAGPAAAIAAISGLAGVGKTQLAVHVGRRLLPVSDLRLSVNLRGHDPGRSPADPAAVLDAFLRILGVPGNQIHHLDLAGRSAMYRRLLAGRRALILLDNAASDEQVRPLLPEGPTCLVLLTSRTVLAALPAAARHLRLDVFTAQEALELLCRMAGADHIDADPDTAARITDLVGRLPLALSLVAGRIAHRPEWTLEDHLARLVERRRHGRLDDGVELSLDLSYDALPAALRRMFRLLALNPGGDIDVYAAAALAGADLGSAQRQLDQLLAASLLMERTPGRYEFHDLVAVYARARAVDDEPIAARRDALTGLFDRYLHTAAWAMDVLYPHERHRRPRVPAPAGPAPPIVHPTEAKAWLDTEHTNLLAAVAHTAMDGWPGHTRRLAATLARYLDTGGHYDEALTVHGHVLRTAREIGDLDAEATALGHLGITLWLLGRHDQALAHLHTSLALNRQVGDRVAESLTLGRIGAVYDRTGRYALALDHLRQAIALHCVLGDRLAEGNARNNLGNPLWRLGRYAEATDHLRQARTIARELGDRLGEGNALNNLGLVAWRLGRDDEALDHFRQTLGIRRQSGDRAGEALALANIGGVHATTRRFREALDYHQRALAIARRIGHGDIEGYALDSLGCVLAKVGRHREALDHLLEALALSRQMGDRSQEASAHNGLGETLRATGRVHDAQRHHESALGVASASGDPYEHARALDGLAHAALALGNADRARHHWRAALDLYLGMGVPEANQVRASLGGLDG